MATAYINGATRAHVARFIPSQTPGQSARYESNCGHHINRDWREVSWTSDVTPTLPWCTWCVGRVRELAADVLGG